MQGWTVAYQGSDGMLHFTRPGSGNLHKVNVTGPNGSSPIAAGTNPLVSTEGQFGGPRIWWHHVDGTLWFFDGFSAPQSLGLTMAPGSSPGGMISPPRGAPAAAVGHQGPQLVDVPDLRNFVQNPGDTPIIATERIAIQAMQNAGLVIGNITHIPAPGPETAVHRQSPPPGVQLVIRGVTTFDLVIDTAGSF
jgi:hypothetical protein